MQRSDVLILGGGHNGLVAATLLARAGRSVSVLERLDHLGGAAVSARVFPGVDARLSRYAYLVSLLPPWLIRELGIRVELRRRPVASYTPVGDGGLLDRGELGLAALDGVGPALGPGLGRRLVSADAVRDRLGDDAHRALAQRPLGELIEHSHLSDVERGIIATDALIGTFASVHDPGLAANRCWLLHTVAGSWDVPVGGMGAVTGELARVAREAGVRLCPGTAAVAVDADSPDGEVCVRAGDGSEWRAGALLANVAPATLAALLGDPPPAVAPEGSQLKLNLVLERLPRLRDRHITPQQAFAGTFHVNESLSQLEAAHAAALAGRLPDPIPCEAYCHSLTDPSILSPALRARGAATLTVFALHLPTRLFRGRDPSGAPIDHDRVKAAAVAATLHSLNSVLDEPIEPLLMTDPSTGRPCLEAHTPVDLEAELGLPGGNIFHAALRWPWAEAAEEVGTWGVETGRPNVLVCGSGARRGGGVSGLPGHNAARALLERRSA